MLSERKGLPNHLHKEIWNKKQIFTLQKLKELKQSDLLIECMGSISEKGYKIAVCSNSIRKTVLTVLSKLGLIEFMDLIISNEDVKNSKPHPEMYWKAISMMGVLPEETLIVEDSPYGLLAASRAKTHILRVKNPDEVTWKNINKKLEEIKSGNIQTKPKWVDKKLNVLIPMAGAGSRFQQAGYTFPKPLIDLKGKPMIQLVVEI
jgi:HAD superfamily hydrolase (TIGR01509 family)